MQKTKKRRKTNSYNDDTGKRFLRKAHAENEEGSAGEESEERAQWTEVLKKLKSETFKRAKLELWFQQGKDPAFARQKFQHSSVGRGDDKPQELQISPDFHQEVQYLDISPLHHLASKISYNLLDADDVMPWGLQKPRIQRLLPGPSQNGPHEWSSSRQSMTQSPSTLARLPDSPPRLLSVRSIERTETSKEASPARSRDATSVPSTFEANFSQKEEAADAPHSPAEIRGNLEDANPSSSTELDSDDSKSEEIESDTHQFEPEQSNDVKNQEAGELDAGISDIAGPLLIDIGANLDAGQEFEDSVDENDDDDEYKQALPTGNNCFAMRQTASQIVSLMTQKDVSEEDTTSQKGKHTRQSWSRVLIESGLSKQQAFVRVLKVLHKLHQRSISSQFLMQGIIEEVDDDQEGNSSLAAKIALKMARIRQLDTILEEKLGKNLYANIVPRKQKKARSPPQPKENTSSSSGRTFVTQTQNNASSVVSSVAETSRSSTSTRQSSVDDEVSTGAKKGNNFIERNKQVVANGMKANMTKEEEDRLEKLLRDEIILVDDSPASEENARPEVEIPPQECNEFTLTEDEKKAIEELIATKSGAYPLSGIDERQDGPTDEVLRLSGGSSRPTKDNIIQETKRERLQRQRLSRVEQELRFLQECPSVVIVGDDRDEDEHDDCRSEISFATVASSTCSTRSGVISRHDFKCFLAQQKEHFRSTPTASADEIRQLLLSIDTGTSASSNVVTATTV
ncbi:hypothetical protein GQ600_21299 [Phytophthora cactorum]|nr:hypothetical protein GQ600_21299 [Phytophthora cactorum]